MAVKVTCGECKHEARLTQKSASWLCPCGADVNSRCKCEYVNIEFEEDNPPDRRSELADLKAKVSELEGHQRKYGMPVGDEEAGE